MPKMQSEVWHKPLHKRKIWRQKSLHAKVIYYWQPFISQLIDTWLQPRLFPTVLKLTYSLVLLMCLLLPIIYPTVVLLFSYAILQFIVERHTGINYPTSLDLLNYFEHLYHYRVTNPKHILFTMMYIERWRLFCSAIASSINYLNVAICLIFRLMDD